jgi:hypothetical protein
MSTPTASPADDSSPEDDMAFNKEILNDLMFNSFTSRNDLIKKFMDPRRDYDSECGYPATENITAQTYRHLYDRDPIAARVVDIMPEECWKTLPEIYEDENSDNETPFELSWKNLNFNLNGGSMYRPLETQGSNIMRYLKRLDKASRIGSFGVLLMGFSDLGPNDSMRKPAPNFENDAFEDEENYDSSDFSVPDDNLGDSLDDQYTDTKPITEELPAETPIQLLYLRVFDESQVQVVRYETRRNSERYGKPLIYQVTYSNLNDQPLNGIGVSLRSEQVHWSRIIHVADNPLSNEIFAEPAMRPVFNRLIDCTKLYGGSAEMYWKGAFPGLSLEIDPKAVADVGIDQAAIKEAMWKYSNSLQRWFSLTGITAKTLTTQVVDPSSQINVQIEAICIKLRVPKRIFMGSERGELASSQDKSSWNETVIERNQNHCIPSIIVEFIDRQIKVGTLVPPAEFYSISWDGIDLSSPTEKATYATQVVTGLSMYIGGGVDTLIEPIDVLTKLYGMKEKTAQSILENRSRTLEDQRAMEDESMLGDPNALPPEGEVDAEGNPIPPSPTNPTDQLPPQKTAPPGRTTPLNGAQISSVKDILLSVSAGTTHPEVAVELLQSVGLSPESALRMATLSSEQRITADKAKKMTSKVVTENRAKLLRARSIISNHLRN